MPARIGAGPASTLAVDAVHDGARVYRAGASGAILDGHLTSGA